MHFRSERCYQASAGGVECVEERVADAVNREEGNAIVNVAANRYGDCLLLLAAIQQ